MSWEQEDSLRRKVREARERQAFRADIKSVLMAKEAQEALVARREAEQGRVRQERVDRDQQRRERAAGEPEKDRSRIIRHLRDGRPERER